MTCAELYPVSAELHGFLAAWSRDRRCPLELVDYLLEQDLPGPAEAARWAATEPRREVYAPCLAGCERGGPCHPYPSMNNIKMEGYDGYGWFWYATHYDPKHAGDVPFSWCDERLRRFEEHHTDVDAMIALLDGVTVRRWDPTLELT